ncbi:MAG: hypothetical protein K5695_04180 [Oscillospiraceae bacterium]|nr:hypothetical protein [Oscillospiraceae bacterium]
MAERSFDAMRQDAIRRSREMQRRAVPPVPETPPVPDIPEIPEMPPKPGLDLGLQGLLSDWDAEKLALAGLLWVLYREGADPALLLALAYILL